MGFLTGIIYLVIGVIACFFGKRFYRVVLALVGFVLGYYLVSGLLVGQSDAILIIASIFGGVAGAVLFWSLYKLGYLLIGAALGLVVAELIANALNLTGVVHGVISVIGLIVGLVLGNSLADLIIRLGTAFNGAGFIVGGIAALAAAANISIPLADPTHTGAAADGASALITIVAVIVLGVIGFVFQTRTES